MIATLFMWIATSIIYSLQTVFFDYVDTTREPTIPRFLRAMVSVTFVLMIASIIREQKSYLKYIGEKAPKIKDTIRD